MKPCPQEGEMYIKIYLCANMVHPTFSTLSYVHEEESTGTVLEG